MTETWAEPTGISTLQQLLAAVQAAPDRAARVALIADVLRDETAMAGLRVTWAHSPAAIEAELAALGSSAGISRDVSTLRRLIRTPLRVVQAHDEGPDLPPPDLRHELGRDDVPPLVIPETWEIGPAGLWRVRTVDGETERDRVTHQPIVVTGRLLDLDTEAVHLALAWPGPTGRLKEVVVPRTQAMDARELVSLAGAGAPVNSAEAGRIVRWLADLEGVNQRILPVGYSSTRCGWLGRKMSYFLAGDELLSSGEPQHDVRLLAEDGAAQLTDAVRVAGSADAWEAVYQRVSGYPLMVGALYAAMTAPILRILDCDNFLFSLDGESGRGKTTALAFAMSGWGNPREGSGLVRGWATTATGAERTAAVLCDMPIALDDANKVPDRDRPRIASTLYMIANGAGKPRGTIKGLAHVVSWKTVALSTSEAPITSYTQDQGVHGRVISVQGHPLGEGNADLSEWVQQQIIAHHGHLGPRLVRWLLDNRDTWDTMRDGWRAYIARFGEQAPNHLARRVAKYIAAMRIAADLLHGPLGLPQPAVDPFAVLWGHVTTTTTAADKARVALESIVAWAVAQRHRFWTPGLGKLDPPGGYLGRWDRASDPGWRGPLEETPWQDDPHELHVLPDALRHRLAELGHQPDGILTEWHTRKWLVTQHNERVNKIRINGSPSPIRVYTLRIDVLD